MLPWKSIIQLQRQEGTPLYLQIVHTIIREVRNGHLTPGQKLPGTRYLADQLELNRKTVVLAYEELMAQDWIQILPSKGAFVADKLPVLTTAFFQNPYLQESRRSPGFSIPEIPALLGHHHPPPGLLKITDGSPDIRLAPMQSLYRHCRRIVEMGSGKKYLAYREVEGEGQLRNVLTTYLIATRGLNCTEEELLITRGSQMGLFLIFTLLLRSGGNVIVGETTYPVVEELVQYLGGKVLRVKVDQEGMVTEEVEALCAKHPITAIYLTPHHHYPTTVTLCAERRLRLLELSKRYRFAIVEDDYDYDYHYSSSPLLPLASLDNAGTVIYLGSFTKCIAPSVRIGYLIAPRKMIVALSNIRKIVDRQGDPVMERALSIMLSEGEVQAHIRKSVKIYRQRRDIFCQLLKKYFKDKIAFTKPSGGMAVWCTFQSDLPVDTFFTVAQKQGIWLEDARQWWSESRSMRLGFASLNEAEMEFGVKAMANILT
ncbi:MAG: GntR family transcriptional regulator [Saprospiraceae bacterium]|nr:MAG: GntR family transcriptional regulator [Saprospiraceae bacterium]